ncbi:MAG: LysM peptidoglycan-binding domain-containing protein [Candidatus Eisenbacteria bacterium]|nr:LysM peptidoglycan-binding domain-containing protein [Candidatus Eisenbacteria bacterium]
MLREAREGTPLRREPDSRPVGRSAGYRVPVGLVVILLLSLGMLQSGCGTGGLAVKKDVWEAQDEFERRQAGLSEKVLRLESRITTLEEDISAIRRAIDELSGQLSDVDSEFSRGLEAVRAGQEQLGIELENRIRSVDQRRESDREDLLDRLDIVLEEVASENRRLREEMDAIRAAMASGGTHTVERGETLASIAADYGVTVSEIAAANDIDNPNLISVGQELVIPR